MAMKRKLKWIAAVLAVLLLGFGTALFLWPRDRITPESWRQIEIGMTENQVEEILGGPGMNLFQLQLKGRHFFTSVSLCEPANYDIRILLPFNEDTPKFWTSQRHCLQIGFDRTGKVRGKVLWESWLDETTFLDRLGDWLGWREKIRE
jgi:hypothetical protein